MSTEPDRPHIPARRRRGSAMHTTRTPYTSDQTARRQRYEQMRRLIEPTTDPSPTPATLDAAVVDALAEQAHALIDAEHHADLCGCALWPADCHTYLGANVLFSTNAHDVVRVAAPLFAAAHADQLAQAHAAGTAEGAAAERERIARAIEAAKPSADRFWDTADAAAVYALNRAAAIARAGTSGDAS